MAGISTSYTGRPDPRIGYPDPSVLGYNSPMGWISASRYDANGNLLNRDPNQYINGNQQNQRVSTQPGVGGFNFGGFGSSSSGNNPSNIFTGPSYDPMKDYNEIGNDFRSLIGRFNQSPNVSPYSVSQYKPSSYNFQPTADYTNAEGQLKDLTQTGGYSQEDINNLRSRGISPIRSVYANAQRNVDRQRSLAGGFSPNYAAVSAKMAREQAGQVSQATQNVNADIADKVNQNKIGAINSLAGLTKSESDLSNQFGARNTEEQNRAQELNVGNQNDLSKFMATFPQQLQEQNNQNLFKSIEGLHSLYGTTPALSQMFENQTMGRAGLQNNINQQNRNRILDLFKSFYGRG